MQTWLTICFVLLFKFFAGIEEARSKNVNRGAVGKLTSAFIHCYNGGKLRLTWKQDSAREHYKDENITFPLPDKIWIKNRYLSG